MYCVDGEIGRFNFKTHRLISENDEFNISKDMFRAQGKDNRNTVLANVLKYLWVGDISNETALLQTIDTQNIKSQASIDNMIGYFERNINFIP
ncbi:MAG: hypothetical protein GYA02_10755 [Clostridiaceae bacterium]|nr:hypothetical protein [Clostridiaceae bacterium]